MTQVYVEPAYAYPTSVQARRFKRGAEGCHYVQQGHGDGAPSVAIAGPFDTRAEAHAAALATGLPVNPRFYRYHPDMRPADDAR